MRFGVMMQTTDRSMPPVRLARESEARGYACIYLPEHTHIPTSRRTPPPTGADELPDTYRRTLDPYIALAACAQATSVIGLGVGVALPAQHDPITFAKQCATLDWMSGGRLVLGVGYGWNHEEMENHGVDPRRRRAVVREHLLCAHALWGQEVAEFHGEFVHMAPVLVLAQARAATPSPHHHRGRGRSHHFRPRRRVRRRLDAHRRRGDAGLPWPIWARAMAAAGRSIDELELVTYGTHPDPRQAGLLPRHRHHRGGAAVPPTAARPTRCCPCSTTTPAGSTSSAVPDSPALIRRGGV